MKKEMLIFAICFFIFIFQIASVSSEPIKLIYHYAGHDILSSDESCQAAKDIGGNAIVRLYYGSDGDLTSFLDMADNYGLKVVVMTSKTKSPCMDDLVCWSEKFATMSLDHPNLFAWTMVDFLSSPNQDWNSPETITEATAAKNAINPDIKFLPELYFDAHLVGGELAYFEEGNPYDTALSDGAELFLWQSYTKDQVDLDQFDADLTRAQSIVPPAYWLAGAYAIRGGWRGYSSTLDEIFYPNDFLSTMFQDARDKAPGLIVYALDGPLLAYYDPQKLLADQDMFGQKSNDDPNFQYKLSSGVRAVMGWYQEVKTTVSLPTGTSHASVKVRVRDNRDTNSGYKYFGWKQLVVNDQVLWEKSIYLDGQEEETIAEDIPDDILSSGSLTVGVRMLSKGSSLAKDSVYVGDLSLSVNDGPYLPLNNLKIESSVKDLVKWIATYQTIKSILTQQGVCGDATCKTSDGENCSTCPADCGTCPLPTSVNPIAYWNFDEGTGTAAYDSSGNSNDGTLVTGPTWAAGKIGSHALSFDGVDDYVSVPSSASLNPSYVTFSMWFNPKSFADNTGLIAKGDNSNRQYWAWIYQGNLSIEINNGGHANNIYPLKKDAWYFLAVTYDGSNIVTYVNGAKVKTISQSNGAILADDGPLLIGKLPGFASFNGTIDDVKIWNRALPASDILDLFNQPNPVGSICGIADSNSDNKISISEIIDYISQWKHGSVAVGNLIGAIEKWKNGC